MAGILDEVVDGIAAKEKQAGTPPTTPSTPPAAPPAAPPATAPKEGEKPMHGYSDDFKEKYGEGKGKKA